MNNVLGTLIDTMKHFLLLKDVAKQLRDAEKAANEAARDRLGERKAAKQRRANLIAEWGLPEKPPTRIGRPSYQQIWDMGLWQMLDEVVNGKIEQPTEVQLRAPNMFIYPSATPLAVVQHHVALGCAVGGFVCRRS